MAKLLIFKSKNRLFGLDVASIGEILPLKGTIDMPTEGKIMIGAVNVRGHTIPLYDFRALIGDKSLLEERKELVSELTLREQDHIAWIDALTQSVKEGSEFRKAICPRSCEFGKWYYSYKAPDTSIERILMQLEEPHNEIHALAEKVLEKSKQGQTSDAFALITNARKTTLTSLLKLLAELKVALVSELRNLFILLKTSSGYSYALCVDGVENVRDPESEKMNCRKDGGSARLIGNIWSSEQSTIYEINLEHLHSLVGSNIANFDYLSDNKQINV